MREPLSCDYGVECSKSESSNIEACDTGVRSFSAVDEVMDGDSAQERVSATSEYRIEDDVMYFEQRGGGRDREVVKEMISFYHLRLRRRAVRTSALACHRALTFRPISLVSAGGAGPGDCRRRHVREETSYHGKE